MNAESSAVAYWESKSGRAVELARHAGHLRRTSPHTIRGAKRKGWKVKNRRKRSARTVK